MTIRVQTPEKGNISGYSEKAGEANGALGLKLVPQPGIPSVTGEQRPPPSMIRAFIPILFLRDSFTRYFYAMLIRRLNSGLPLFFLLTVLKKPVLESGLGHY